MKKVAIVFSVLAFVFSSFHRISKKYNNKPNQNYLEQISDKNGDWIYIFDGKTFKGWHTYLSNTINEQWQIEDNAMVFTPNPKYKEGASNLVTDKEYTDFILSIDWKISKRGNSGIFWGVFENEKYPIPYQTGPEIQVLDEMAFIHDNRQTHRAGSLYDMVGPSELVVNGIDEWNTCVLEVNHKINKGNVWLNGTHIASFPVEGSEWDALIANSKFKNWELFGTFKTGRIGVQDHGAKVSYRNIKIKEL